MDNTEKYISALHFRQLTPFYDPLLRWGMHEDLFKCALIRQAGIRPGMRVLDLGCGTGTLTILVKQTYPTSDVTGLDCDPEVLQIAREKAASAGVEVALDQDMAFDLPYPGGSFDRVLSSLMIHHLTRQDKKRSLSEVYRVLCPGGELHIVDFGIPHSVYGRLASQFSKHLEQVADNLNGLLPGMMSEAGFHQVEVTANYGTIFGTLSLYRGRKP